LLHKIGETFGILGKRKAENKKQKTKNKKQKTKNKKQKTAKVKKALEI